MEKHRAYFELMERLPAGGCAVCSLLRDGLDSYLNGYLEEGVTDEDNWGALKAAQGWCGRHARQLEAKADGLAVALFYGHLLQESLESLPRGPGLLEGLRRRLARPAAPCPGCRREAEAEGGWALLVARAAGEPDAQALMRAHLELCVPHLRLALARARGGAADWLRRDQAGKLGALRAELELFTRKTSQDGRGRGPLGPEADSWKRVLRRWYGPRWKD